MSHIPAPVLFKGASASQNPWDLNLLAATCVLAGLVIKACGVDQILFLWMNQSVNPGGAIFWQSMTVFGDTLVAVALLLPLVIRNRRAAVAFWFTIVNVALLVHLLKSGLDLPRPPSLLRVGEYFQWGPLRYGKSFPSGHSATIAATLTLWICYMAKGWKTSLLIMVMFVVGFSRVAVGVHWPSDVLAGVGLGCGVALLADWVSAKVQEKTARRVWAATVPLMVLSALYLATMHKSGYVDVRWVEVLVGVGSLGYLLALVCHRTLRMRAKLIAD